MYEIKENRRKLFDGTEITTYTRDVVSANILQVEAGTTGYKGGDTGHGGRTYFRISDEASTDIHVTPFMDRFGCNGFEVTLFHPLLSGCGFARLLGKRSSLPLGSARLCHVVAGTGGYAALGSTAETDITSYTDTVHEAVCKMQAAFILHKGGIFS